MKKIYIFLLFVALAFAEPSSKDESDLTVEGFVRESKKRMNELCLDYVDYLRDIEKYKQAEDKDAILAGIHECGDALKGISSAASAFKLERINDGKLRQAVKQLRKWGGPLKIGDDLIHLGINVKLLKDSFTENIIDSLDSDDIKYSVEDVDSSTTDITQRQELQYYWQASTDFLRDNAKEYFFDVVKLIQTNAKRNNMTASEFWYPNFNIEILREFAQVMRELKPLHAAVHAFVRQKLYQRMGAGAIKSYGPISADIYKRFLWHSGQFSADMELINQIINDKIYKEPDNLFKQITDDVSATEKFLKYDDNMYQSLGFEPLDDEFWESADILYSPWRRCLGKASSSPLSASLSFCHTFNYYQNSENYVILSKIHAAKLKKPLALYEFDGYYMDEAIGNAIKLSAFAPKSIENAFNRSEFTKEESLKLNFRYAIAAVLSIPNAYVNMRVIIAFLNGKVKKQNLNRFYWSLMETYAGVEPPIDREDDSLDLPYSVYLDLNENINIIDRFRASILSYQIYRGVCQYKGHVGPLQNCQFEDDKDIGKILKEMIKLGSSEPLEDVLSRLFKSKTKLDASALLDYFAPTSDWLNTYKRKQQKRIIIGWEHSTKVFSKRFFSSEKHADAFATKSSNRIYELYDQISTDLFAQKYRSDEFVIGYENTFWKTSNTAVAASELKDISLMAQQYDVTSFNNKTLKIALRKLSQVADVFVLGEEMEQFYHAKEVLANLSTEYHVPKYQDEGGDETILAYYPDIINVFMSSDDNDELIYYWQKWRENNMDTCKTWLSDMLSSFEKAANILGISTSQFWFKNYKVKFVDYMEEVINELSPLYKSLHAYLRKRLDRSHEGAIPDHIMEKQLLVLWSEKSIVEKDFPFAELVQYDKLISKQNWDAAKLLHMADDFYKSLGFMPMPEEFWNNQVKSQQGSKDSEACHANVYDKTPKVYIKYCEKVSAKKFFQAHGYMGKVHYAVEKAELPAYFFDSYYLEYPVGEAVVISATSPKHLRTIGLLEDKEWSEKVALNRLIRVAINSLVKLFRNFVNTKVVFDYLQGEVEMTDITRYYWELMIKYAGIEPPVDRSEEDFDFPYEFYTDLEQNHQFQKFLSEVMGYGMFEKFCELSGHEGDLSNCDFYGSEKVGELLKKIMNLGSTIPEGRLLKLISPTAADLFSGEPLLHYFKPLRKWLASLDLPEEVPFNRSLKKFYVPESFIPEEEEQEEEEEDEEQEDDYEDEE